jgi:hypothetical protein
MNWLARESPANALCFTHSLPFRDGIFFGAAFFALFRATGVGVITAGSTTKAESESSAATISELRGSLALQ